MVAVVVVVDLWTGGGGGGGCGGGGNNDDFGLCKIIFIVSNVWLPWSNRPPFGLKPMGGYLDSTMQTDTLP